MKKLSKIVLLLLSLISIGGCGNSSSSENTSSSEEINDPTAYEKIDKSVANVKTKEGSTVMPFNTIVTLRTFCEKDHDDIYPTFNTEMQRLHILFDRYNDFVDRDGNDIINLKTINESYGSGEKLVVDQDLIDLLNISFELATLTEGYFNPTLGELIDTWNYKVEDGETYIRFSPYCLKDQDPNVNDINSSKSKIIPYDELSDYIVIDDEENTVEFKKYQNVDKVTISLGAIAKGYAIEKAKAIVDLFDVPAMIDGGSSSSYGIGTNPNPERDYWAIGIASPYKSIYGVQSIATLRLDDTYTLSVSGDYESCYKNEQGILRHHILNPYSGYPENYNRVISLKSTSRSDVLDGLSTALFNIESLDKVMEIVKNVEEHYNLEIAIMLEKEVVVEDKKKIDIYLNEAYDQLITKTNEDFFNTKIYLESGGEDEEN